jgi:hypothetical protein
MTATFCIFTAPEKMAKYFQARLETGRKKCKNDLADFFFDRKRGKN